MTMRTTLPLVLAFFLFEVSAGTAATAPQKPKRELELSGYEPTSARNPFMKPGVSSASAQSIGTTPVVFRLQGILYSAKQPAAMVNNVLVELDKPVTIVSGNVEVQVKAVSITRDTVVLEAGGQRAELRISDTDSATGAAAKDAKSP